jgi:phage protein D
VTIDRSGPIMWLTAVQDSASQGVRLEKIWERMLSLEFTDDEKKADKFVLTLDNYDCEMYDDPAFKKGLTLDVQWGYPGNMAPARRGIVQTMKGGLTINVECIARSILMNKKVKSRIFENVRRSDVVRLIAAEHGYGAEVIEIDETEIVYAQITQAQKTDAQFVRYLATLEGFEFYIDHLGFHFHARRLNQNPVRTYRWFTNKDLGGEILDFSIDNDITAKKARRRARGRDPLERTEIDESASDSEDTDGESLAEIIEILDPEADVFNETDANTVSEDVVPTSATSAIAAAAENRGRFRRNKLVAIKLKLTVIGDPQMQSKTIIKVEGLGERISGMYYVRKVVSKVSESGFTQELECISNGTGGVRRRSRLGDLELPTRGTPTAGNTRAADATPTTGMIEEQVFNEETGRYDTVYSPSVVGRPAQRPRPIPTRARED